MPACWPDIVHIGLSRTHIFHGSFIYSKQMLRAFAVVGRNLISSDSSYCLAIVRLACAFCATHANQFK